VPFRTPSASRPAAGVAIWRPQANRICLDSLRMQAAKGRACACARPGTCVRVRPCTRAHTRISVRLCVCAYARRNRAFAIFLQGFCSVCKVAKRLPSLSSNRILHFCRFSENIYLYCVCVCARVRVCVCARTHTCTLSFLQNLQNRKKRGAKLLGKAELQFCKHVQNPAKSCKNRKTLAKSPVVPMVDA
jgi:hypothetical protein